MVFNKFAVCIRTMWPRCLSNIRSGWDLCLSSPGENRSNDFVVFKLLPIYSSSRFFQHRWRGMFRESGRAMQGLIQLFDYPLPPCGVKGTVQRDFWPPFLSSFKPAWAALTNRLKHFRFLFRFGRVIRIFLNLPGVSYPVSQSPRGIILRRVICLLWILIKGTVRRN